MSGFRDAEQNDGMIDGQRREFHKMDNGQMIFFERGGQCPGGARLVRTGKGKNHPPMAPQNIRAPHAAALSLKNFFLCPAEFAQSRKAGNYNPFFGLARRARIAGHDRTNPLLVNFISRDGLIRDKPRMVKKLPGHTRGKTARWA